MSSASRTIRVWLLVFMLAAYAGAQSQVPQNSGKPKPRNIEVVSLPSPQQNSDAVAPTERYAVVIGIDKYENLPPDRYLRYAQSDANHFYATLLSHHGGEFPADHIRELIGAQATLANIRDALENWLPSVAQEQDMVEVYFVGHGGVHDGRGYLAPWDVRTNDIEKTAYPMDRLAKILADNVRAKFKIIYVDACHSETLTPETSNESVNRKLSQMADVQSGLLVFSASHLGEQSYGDSSLAGGSGVFTYFLDQGLRGYADTSPCDGTITAYELIQYVSTEVSAWVRSHDKNAYQIPTASGDFDDRMQLAGDLFRGCAHLGTPLVPLGTIAVESNMDNVQVYLNGKLVGIVSKGKPLILPGLDRGMYVVKGVIGGYDPVTRTVEVDPGQEKTVKLIIQFRREYKPTAMKLLDRGESLLFKRSLVSRHDPLIPRSGQTKADLRKARRDFEQALKVDPDYPKAAYDLALTCLQLSDDAAADKAFELAIELDPPYIDAREDYAGQLIEDGDPDEAIRQLTHVLALKPNDVQAYSMMSHAYLDEPAFDRAIEYAGKALAVKPTYAEAYLWQALALSGKAFGRNGPSERKELYEQAADNYHTYLVLTNFSTPLRAKLPFILIGLGVGHSAHADRQASYVNFQSVAYMGLCQCEDQLGRLLSARSDCRHAIKYDPNEPLNYFLFGKVYVHSFSQTQSRDDLVSAQSNFVKMLDINSNLEESKAAKEYLTQIQQTLRTPLLERQGHLDAVIRPLLASLSGTAKDRSVYLKIANVYYQARRYPEAESAAQKALALSPELKEQEEPRLWLGSIYEQEGKYDSAEEQYKLVLSLNSANVTALNYLGYMLVQRGVRLPEAVKYIQRALQIEPENGNYLDSLGWAYYKMSDFQLAERQLEKAVRFLPNDPSVREHLGYVYSRLGKVRQAEKEWERALTLSRTTLSTDFDREHTYRLQRQLGDLERSGASQ